MTDKRQDLMDETVESVRLENAPDGRVYDFGRWLSGVLKEQTGEDVDTGAGFDAFDLWVKKDGAEFFVSITLSKATKKKEMQ